MLISNRNSKFSFIIQINEMKMKLRHRKTKPNSVDTVVKSEATGNLSQLKQIPATRFRWCEARICISQKAFVDVDFISWCLFVMSFIYPMENANSSSSWMEIALSHLSGFGFRMGGIFRCMRSTYEVLTLKRGATKKCKMRRFKWIKLKFLAQEIENLFSSFNRFFEFSFDF